MFEEVVADLDPAQVFSWTGKFDPEEGALRLRSAAMATLAALDTLGGKVPDSPMIHDQFAHAAALPGGKSFRLIRDSLIQAGLLDKVNMKDGLTIMLTPKGVRAARRIKDEVTKQGPSEEEPEEGEDG